MKLPSILEQAISSVVKYKDVKQLELMNKASKLYIYICMKSHIFSYIYEKSGCF